MHASNLILNVHSQGIRKTHQEFRYASYMNIPGTRALHGWSAIGDSSNSDDCLGHGTHVSGSVGGLTYGVAKNATLYAGVLSYALETALPWIMPCPALP